MTARRLSADEAALWRRVAATARPIDPRRAGADMAGGERGAPGARARPAAPAMPAPNASPAAAANAKPNARAPGRTLDAGWDRRLARGAVVPDSVVDLHGHTLDSAHRAIDHALARAIARHDRVVLLVTGKPPRGEDERPHARGRIRAAVGDWLAASRHAGRIAAVRGAHPRHGGAGALYLILRRDRSAG